jgi:PAS domain S-box-containing protein
MNRKSQSRSESAFYEKYFVLIFTITALVISLLDLVGWLFDITIFKSMSENWIPMKVVTAICFVLSALSLLIIQQKIRMRAIALIPAISGIFVFLIGITSAWIHLKLLKTGNESILSETPFLELFLSTPNRMALITAVNFSFIGAIILLFSFNKKSLTGIAHILILPVFIASYIVLASYILGVHSLHNVNNISVALNTGIAFTALCIAVFFVRLDSWLMKVFTSRNGGGLMSRILIPGLLILPIVIGWFRISGERTGLFTSEVGVILVALTYMICFVFLTWLSARSVNRTDEKRKKLEEARLQDAQRLKYHLENSPLAVIEWNADFVVTQWSNEAERIFGWNEEETLGKRIDSLNLIYKEDIPIVNSTMERLIGGKEKTVVSSNRNYTKSGKVIECTWYNSVLADNEGKMTSVMSLIQDITESKQHEEFLRENKEQLSAVFNGVSETIMLLDVEGNVLAANKIAIDRINQGKNDFVGKNIFDNIPAQFHEERKKQISELIRTKKPVKFQNKFEDSFFDFTFYPVFDTQGNVIQFISSALDITERKNAEEALKENENLFRAVFEQAAVGVALLNTRTGRYIRINQKYCDFVGYTMHEMLQKTLMDVTYEPDIQTNINKNVQFIEGAITEYSYEKRYVRKDREIVWGKLTISPLWKQGEKPEEYIHIAIVEDITERKKAEEAIAASEHEFRLLTESMPQIVWTTTADGQNTYFNHQWMEYTGLTLEESYGHGWNKPFHPDDQQRAWDAWQNAVLHNAAYLLQCRLRRFDGVYRWWLIHGVPVVDKNGTITKWYGTCTDIDEMKNAGDAILHNEQLLHSVIENVSSGVALIDETGKFVVYNPVFLKLFGLSPDSTIKNINDQDWSQWQVFDENKNLLHVDDHPVRKAAMTGKLVKNQLVAMKLPSGGDYIWMMISAEPLQKEDGSIDKIICTYLDITERKRMEEALAKMGKLLSESQKIAHLGSFEYIAETQTTVWSEEEFRIYGLDPLEPSPQYDVMLAHSIHPDDVKLLNDTFSAAMHNGSIYELEHRIVRPDGSIRFVYDIAHPYFDSNGKLLRYIGATLDITERKQAEEALRQTSERLNLAQHAAKVGTWDWDIITGQIEWSIQMFDLFGLDPLKNNASFEVWNSILHPDDLEQAGFLIDQALKQQTLLNSDYRIISPDGQERWINSVGEGKYNNQGQPVRMIGVCMDITERKRVEDALRESEENYHRLFEFSAIPIWKEDYSELKKHFDELKSAGVDDFRKYFEAHKDVVIHLASLIKVVEINHKSVEFFGVESKEDVIKNMLFYFNEESLDVFKEELIILFEGGKQFECEMPIRTLSGEIKILDMHLSVVKGFEDTLSNILVSFIDITERKRFENELKEKNIQLEEINDSKDKFFKIIAHDMKNPYISLLGASELLYENANKYDKDKIVTLTKVLHDSAKSGYDMLINMLEWSRSQAGSMLFQPEKINLKELIQKNLSSLFDHASGKKITLKFNIAGNLQVNADKNMLNTILRNLINNALKYTHTGGAVTVGAKNENDSVIITVKDTGTGIEKRDFDKLFRTDIKFSQPGTEHEGGTGLGLLLCKEFVEKHGGRIWVESEVGKGSTFYFSLDN